MAQEINLIPKEVRNNRKEEVFKRYVSRIAFAVFGFCTLLTLIAFAYSLYKNDFIKRLTDSLTKEEDIARTLKRTEGDLTILDLKCSQISSVLNNRQKFSKLLFEIGGLLPQGVKVTDLTYSGGDLVTIGGITPSYSALADLIRNIDNNSESEGSVFLSSEVTSVNLQEDLGKISFSLNVSVAKSFLLDADKL